MGMVKKDIVLLIISLTIGGLIPVTVFGADFYFKSGHDIQLYDTYFVFRPFDVTVATTGLSLFFVFLVRSIRTGLKNRTALVLLTIGAMMVGRTVVKIYQVFFAN
jgi:hypothetical protein